ncbi:MAG: hypothetical protein P8048_08415 [Calditrichia bacterium]
MFIRKIILILLLISPTLFLPHCEKITGYNYDVNPLNNTVRVYGEVINTFSGQAVEDALVQIGIQTTSTDIYGEYQVQYILGAAEDRNQPVPVAISAPNYETLNTSFIIYPEPTRLDFQLVYAAPIIEQNSLLLYRGLDNEPQEICQAIIVDYQGVNDIKEVNASFNYIRKDNPNSFYFTYPLNLIETNGGTEGHNQAIIPKKYMYHQLEWSLYTDRYELQAEDYEGHIHHIIGDTSKVVPDPLLFDPGF